MTKFILIRHATNDTVGKKIAGRMPGVHLNDEGKKQAQNLAHQLKKLSINVIYSSPLERCIETIEPFAEAAQLAIVPDANFIEIEYGLWTNCTLKELEKDIHFQHWNSFRSGTRIPQGEMMIEVQARMVAGIQSLSQKHPEQTVVIVSHGDPIKAVLAYYMGVPIGLIHTIQISPASINMLELYDDSVKVVVMNHIVEFII